MTEHVNISNLLDKYLVKHPDEEESLNRLIALLEKYQERNDRVDRINFAGHVTASAIIICRETRKMLKINHPIFNFFLQPGGHIRPNQSILESVKNRLSEFGLLFETTYIPAQNTFQVPIDIDSHLIPENIIKGEPEHWHHDFRYLFVCQTELVPNTDEEYTWDKIPDLKNYETFENLIDKVQRVWSKEYEEQSFYNNIVNEVGHHSNIVFVAVQHFLPGVEYFLNSLENIGRVGLVIPKPKSLVDSIYIELQDNFHIERITDRGSLKHNSQILTLFSNLKHQEKIVFLDIGGWFSEHIDYWNSEFPGKILGVVEDTENGHQKYEKIKSNLPIVSVARSPLKVNEDTLIGQSIVFSTDSILRSHNKLLRYLKCGVIGYGKVGKSIAHDLMKKSVAPMVCEIDPLRAIEAYNDGNTIGTKTQLLNSCDVIFCATGNNSITTKELFKLKRGAYLASVTSGDDEFSFEDIGQFYRAERVDEFIQRHYKFDSSFYLMNEGNAVNFLHNAVVGDFIHLVKAEMLLGINVLLKKNELSILEVDNESRHKIAIHWLKSFEHNFELINQDKDAQ